MLQQVHLMKEREQLFGYKKSAPLISTSCAPHCEKSHLKGGAGEQRGSFSVFRDAGMRAKRGEYETASFNDRRFVLAACGGFCSCIGP
jgi:hypothetical protein